MAEEPSHKRKRVAIDHAQAQRRHDAQPFAQPSDAASGPGRARSQGGHGHERARYRDASAPPRRTRIPYAEHGAGRPGRGRGGSAQQGRAAQGRQAVAFHDEAPRQGRESRRSRNEGAPSQEIVLQTPPMGGSARVLNPSASLLPAWAKLVLMLVAAVALLWAGTRLLSCAGQPQPNEAAEVAEAPAVSSSPLLEARLASYAAYDSPASTDLDALPEGTGTAGFALSGQEGVEVPSLGAESSAAIEAALAPFEQDGFDVGFVLMDIGTGRGFAHNIDEPIYGASSFKGPYCAYVAQSYVDSGEVALAEVSDSIFNTIVYSDNGTYDSMRSRFSDSRLVEWLGTLGVDGQVAYDTWYPTYTARDSAKLWLAVYGYLQGDGAAAEQLRSDFSRTKTSFMRTAVDEDAQVEIQEAQEGEEAIEEAETFGSGVSEVLIEVVEEATADEVSVMDKAGWYPRDADDIPAIVDAGIVTCNGRDYLLCVMTDMPWTEPNQETAEALIDAVFAARRDLA